MQIFALSSAAALDTAIGGPHALCTACRFIPYARGLLGQLARDCSGDARTGEVSTYGIFVRFFLFYFMPVLHFKKYLHFFYIKSNLTGLLSAMRRTYVDRYDDF